MPKRVCFTEEEKQEDIKDVEKLLRENMSYSQIASLLGRSIQYVADIRTYLKDEGILSEEELLSIKNKYLEKKLKERDKKVLSLLSQGYTKNEIHFMLNIQARDVNESVERIEASGVDTKQFKTRKEIEREARKRKIRKLIKKGYYREQIANETHIPRTTVNRIVEELISERKLRRKDVKSSQECQEEINKTRNDKIKELVSLGLSYKEISEIVGVCTGTISNVINGRSQVGKKKNRKKDETIKEIDDNLTEQEKDIIKYLKIGYSYVTIRKLVGLSQPDLMQIVKKLKKEKYINQIIINEALQKRKEYHRNTIKRLIINGYSQSDILRYLNANAEEVTSATISRTVTELLSTGEISEEQIQDGIDESSSSYKSIDAKVLEFLKQGLIVKEIIEADEDGYLTENRVRRSKKRLVESGQITEAEITKYRKKKEKEDKEEIYKEEEKIIWAYASKESLTMLEISEKTGQCLAYIQTRMLHIRKKKKLTLKDLYRIRKEAKEKLAMKREEEERLEQTKKRTVIHSYLEAKEKVKKLMDEGIDKIDIYNEFFKRLQEIISLGIEITKEDVDILSYIVLYSEEHNKVDYASYVIDLYLRIHEYVEAEKFLNIFYQDKKKETEFYNDNKQKIRKLMEKSKVNG